MRQFILILTVSIFFISCGQNENKQKELELKEKELALKQRELDLKEKESNTQSQKDNTAKPNTTQTATTVTSDHSKFANFWTDFKSAVLSNDKEAVFALTNLPFDDANDVYSKTNSVTSKSKEQFMSNFDRIFNPDVINAIKNNKYYACAGELVEEEPSLKGTYILTVEHGRRGKELQDLAFRKIKGNFMLYTIQYWP